MVLRGAYLTVDWVINGEEEEQSYAAEERDPLSDEVKLFRILPSARRYSIMDRRYSPALSTSIAASLSQSHNRRQLYIAFP